MKAPHIIDKILSFLIIFTVWTGCNVRRSNDEYLASLPQSSDILEPVDSLALEQFGLVLPSRLVKYGRWVIIKQVQAKNNLVILNLDTYSKMELLRVGRGPGEMLQGAIAYLDGSKLVVAEANSLMTVSMDMDLLREGFIPPLDTLGVFKSPSNIMPKFSKVNGGYLSVSALSDDAWYSLWDVDGYVGNSVCRPHIPGFEHASLSTKASFYGSSLLATHPNGDRVCVALVGMSAISFSVIENRELEEIKRYVFNEPTIVNDGQGAYISNEESIECFHGIASNKDYVYLLYSGKKWPADANGVPSYECNHLLVYDWEGNFVTRYYLSQNVLDIFLDGDELYCLSQFPSEKIYVYHMPKSMDSR